MSFGKASGCVVLSVLLGALSCSESSGEANVSSETARAAPPSQEVSPTANNDESPKAPKDQNSKEATPVPNDPSDAEALRVARNTAILEERMNDALRLCSKENLKKVKEQGVMACVLTACRVQNTSKAKAWASLLGPKSKAQATKACAGVL